MNTVQNAARTWPKAYLSFLMSKDENLLLKVAPVILIFGTPEVLISNLIPVVGESLDIGTFGVAMLVLYRTARAVRKYR